MLDLDLALRTARRAAEAASRAALAHFRTGVRVELKPDRSPVTVADREAEAAAIGAIREAFPEHGLLGEESGSQGPAATRWIIDPLDGTRGFTRGESCWGPLVALQDGGEIVAGAMALPVTGEVWFAARGLGTWEALAGGGEPRRLHVSSVDRWEGATFSLGEPRTLLAPPLAGPIGRLATTCARTRCLGDLAGFAMVLTGRAEAWVEAGVQLWDLAPMQVLLEEAGGRFTDLAGEATVCSGNCIASNGLLHDHVMAALLGS